MEVARVGTAAVPQRRAPGSSSARDYHHLVVARLSDAAVPRRATADPRRHVRSRGARQCNPVDELLAYYAALAEADTGVGGDVADRRATAAVRTIAAVDRGGPERRVTDRRAVPVRNRLRTVGAGLCERRGGSAVPDHPCGHDHPILGDRTHNGGAGWALVSTAAGGRRSAGRRSRSARCSWLRRYCGRWRFRSRIMPSWWGTAALPSIRLTRSRITRPFSATARRCAGC